MHKKETNASGIKRYLTLLNQTRAGCFTGGALAGQLAKRWRRQRGDLTCNQRTDCLKKNSKPICRCRLVRTPINGVKISPAAFPGLKQVDYQQPGYPTVREVAAIL